ncbi:Cas10/Cmr2 second palm domain-containing protein [Scytonema sp. NUACC26]|uniref:Cas10/Cmr2 second palm domain-containing protein n=1 Tax=Scytonema sp. NUACC26 TaxID=3140176 RepID=UPI0034DC0C0D
MNKYVVTVLDTTGIQPYIFNSNRLQENIGASYLVAQATGDWVQNILEEELGIPKQKQYEPIISSGLNAEIIYIGGGNALVLFSSMEIAKLCTKKLSWHILTHAPGINLVAAHKEFTWDECLFSIVQKLIDNELEQLKRAKVSSVPLLGVSVTASCNSTQLAAVGLSDKYIGADEQDIYLISRETEAKLIAAKLAIKRLREKFQDCFNGKVYDFAYRMDHLGRSINDTSFYAVVHADGNSMGKRFKEFGIKGMAQNSNDPNRGYITAMRSLSISVNNAGEKAIEAVIKSIIASIDNEHKVMSKFLIFSDKDGKKYLPFRPLIYGGDDVTFVCDGRLGLELAQIYLKELEKQHVADGKTLYSCAGVCIVKSHYPFARAYALSEALCGTAKKFVKEQNKQWSQEFSAIDWHIAASGLFGSIGDIRQREYKVNEGDLIIRPILIQEEENQWRTWSNFTSIMQAFNQDKEWKGRRNKVIALREKLREGQDATKQFLTACCEHKLPAIREASDTVQTTGWVEQRCGYFDAIEAMEFYFPLNKGESSDCLQTEN